MSFIHGSQVKKSSFKCQAGKRCLSGVSVVLSVSGGFIVLKCFMCLRRSHVAKEFHVSDGYQALGVTHV